jgi:ActR/RegA family two-component response regulator
MAEGVETEAQVGFLRRNHCDQLQGYLFGPPASADALEQVLRRRYLRPELFANTSAGRTLLLLDDEENVLRALLRVFRREGYRILTASRVQEAFELLATNEVQVILSDQRMSDMSGTEFLGRVKELYPDTVRMVLSGYTDLATVTDAINRGAIYRFLTKPWEDDELRAHIREAFRTHDAAHGGSRGCARLAPAQARRRTGSTTVNTAPPPGGLATSMRPWCLATIE